MKKVLAGVAVVALLLAFGANLNAHQEAFISPIDPYVQAEM